MSTNRPVDYDLLERIKAFCQATKMTPTALGIAALGDSAFVTTLRRGRDIRRSTRERVVAFMAGHLESASNSDVAELERGAQ